MPPAVTSSSSRAAAAAWRRCRLPPLPLLVRHACCRCIGWKDSGCTGRVFVWRAKAVRSLGERRQRRARPCTTPRQSMRNCMHLASPYRSPVSCCKSLGAAGKERHRGWGSGQAALLLKRLQSECAVAHGNTRYSFLENIRLQGNATSAFSESLLQPPLRQQCSLRDRDCSLAWKASHTTPQDCQPRVASFPRRKEPHTRFIKLKFRDGAPRSVQEPTMARNLRALSRLLVSHSRAGEAVEEASGITLRPPA